MEQTQTHFSRFLFGCKRGRFFIYRKLSYESFTECYELYEIFYVMNCIKLYEMKMNVMNCMKSSI